MDPVEWPDDPGPGHDYGNEGQPPAAPAPPSSGTPPAAPKPAATVPQPGTGEPPAGQRTGDDQFIPKHRFDELNGNFTKSQAELEQLRRQNEHAARIIRAYQGQDPDAPRPKQLPPEEEERRTRLRGVLEELYHGLKNLDAIATSMAAQERQTTQGNDRYSQRAIQSALDTAAKNLLGEGKTGKDLSPQSRVWLKDSFITWVMGDQARAAAFDEGQPVDYEAFWNDYHREMRAGAARSQNAELARRGVLVNRLPNGGPSAAAVATAPPDLNFSDADAVHKAAWRGATADR